LAECVCEGIGCGRYPIELRNLYVSPGHNFFGHHGKEPSGHATEQVPSIRCVAGRGIEGDRFFEKESGHKGQITFFSFDTFKELCQRLDPPPSSPSLTRRNVVVAGLLVERLVGRLFEIDGVRFAGVEECRPCEWMDRAMGAGAREVLRGRGGLRARILSDGVLRVGNTTLTVLQGSPT
jgi:MOSC domain-containing protein YiiM